MDQIEVEFEMLYVNRLFWARQEFDEHDQVNYSKDQLQFLAEARECMVIGKFCCLFIHLFIFLRIKRTDNILFFVVNSDLFIYSFL